MPSIRAAAFTVFVLVGSASAQPNAADASYAIGADLGRTTLERLQADGVTLDEDRVVSGFRDAITGGASEMTDEEIREALQELEAELRRKEAAELLATDPVYRALHEANIKRSETFLAAFAAEEDVTSLAGGVLLQIEAFGDGPTPGAGDGVVVSFESRNLDGDIVSEGQSVTVSLKDVVAGAQTVLSSVPVGTSGVAVLPPSVAFGEVGRPPEIGPNEVLWIRFTLEGVAQ